MNPTTAQHQLLRLCAIRGVNWNLLAREAQEPAGLQRLLAGELSESTEQARVASDVIQAALLDQEGPDARVGAELANLSEDVRLTTVLDDDYPENLRLIFNLPPFLFYRGKLEPNDARSVAVVGTRKATEEGLGSARVIAGELARRGVTVLSGLALGIDTAAHEATLAAGGRTIAVFGTGIREVYPRQNVRLATEIVEAGGAVVSQFWPSAPPRRENFPMRNVVTSGMGQGTVVVEAKGKSGARNQARRALEHGKRVFLLKDLVTSEPWAKDYAEHRGAIEVSGAGEIVELLRSPEEIAHRTQSRHQLVLDLV